MEKIILQQFRQFLASKINVKEKYILYYANWVKQAYHYTNLKKYHAPLNARQNRISHYLVSYFA